MSRPKKLQDAGVRKSTAELAKKLSAAVSRAHYLDKWNNDEPITTFCPLETLALIAANPKMQEQRPEIVVAACKELAQYIFEKRKAAEPVAAQATQVIVTGADADGVQRVNVRTFERALPAPLVSEDELQ